ncbi:Putative oxidoreductase SadH [Aquimixticola soesokkakensis]|uniref:Putative oxidoreductase SadH n=1 Tax=Aquimixticola soesokkakensis TaxID=1519096 RepID=A0A1Y5RJH8_9RHOB|nr:SDR family NAD(P)-dependent oxidoreductase [Aquimixticola soesokkakensis]SLN18795.1 Putative oxidoreductase SadH [Aquimixticola soesokkakensis]
MQRSILITGCSSGIGKDAALTLHKQGWRVFATCRAQADCEALRALGLESLVLDYESGASIDAAVDAVLQRTGGTLDALFNNGAYAIPAAVEDLPTDALRANFEANFFGWHSLTRRVIPVMRAQGHGRIIQCSSVLGLVALPWRGSYNATKFALEGLTDTLRCEMRGTGIHVSTIEPGPIRTDFRINARKMFERWIDWQASPRADQYRDSLMKRLYAQAPAPDRFELGPEAVTAKLLHALDHPRPRPHYYVTTATYIAGIARRLLPARAIDALMGRI